MLEMMKKHNFLKYLTKILFSKTYSTQKILTVIFASKYMKCNDFYVKLFEKLYNCNFNNLKLQL